MGEMGEMGGGIVDTDLEVDWEKLLDFPKSGVIPTEVGIYQRGVSSTMDSCFQRNDVKVDAAGVLTTSKSMSSELFTFLTLLRNNSPAVSEKGEL